MKISNMQCASWRRPDGGFTLVEVLVSLVVLSVGLLGMAKLVLVSAHSNDSAYLRSQATALGYEILDNMRSNMTAATATGYDTPLGTTPAAPTSCVGTGTVCTPSQQAAWDVYSWKQHLDSANALGGGLPSGKGSVVTSATVPVTATIIVQWDDSAAQCAFGPCTIGTASPMSITLETSLQ
jgi:type IV pilus assembly protein PilV